MSIITSARRSLRVLRSARVRAALGLGVVLTLGTTGTFAYWTDDVTVAGTTFTSGTLALNVNGNHTPPSYAALTVTTMAPGDSVAGVITVSNAGNIPLKYTETTTATNPDSKALAAALTYGVYPGGSVSGSGSAKTCTGTQLQSGTGLGSLAIASRRLDPGGGESLCIQVGLPSGAANTLMGATTAVTFAFNATSNLA